MADEGAESGRRRFPWIYLLLLVPFVATLWVPFYNRSEPEIAGIPFFYWYQLLWIPLGVFLLLPVYLFENRWAPKAGRP